MSSDTVNRDQPTPTGAEEMKMITSTATTYPGVEMCRQVLVTHQDVELVYYSPANEGDAYEAVGYVPYTYCRAEDASGAYSRHLTIPEVVAVVRRPESLFDIPSVGTDAINPAMLVSAS